MNVANRLDLAKEPLRSSLWEATAMAGGEYPALSGDRTADVAVVGGGILGLSSALELTGRSRSVALIEAQVPGWGASGRNGGQVIPGLKHDPDEIERALGPRLGPRVVETVGGAAGHLFDLVRRLGIDCDAAQNGWIQAAHSSRALAAPLVRARQWAARGAPVEVLGAREITDLIGSDGYVGGWIDRRAGGIQPLSFVRGLAQAATAAGVQIHGHTPALAITRSGDGWRIRTPGGSLTTGTVILATNGYTDGLWPGLRQTVVPVFSMQIATEPLPEAALRRILPGRQVVSDTRNLLRYFRVDGTGRLLMGARGPFRDEVALSHAGSHIRAIGEIFPELGPVRIEHVWAGRVAMTADHLPHVHTLAPGVFAGLGFNGRGVALATRLGKALADLTEGRDSEEIGFPVTRMQPLRGHAFSGIAARLMVFYYGLKDKIG